MLSLGIGIVSGAAGLRLAFGGVVFAMYAIGGLVCLALMRVYRKDVTRRGAFVHERMETILVFSAIST